MTHMGDNGQVVGSGIDRPDHDDNKMDIDHITLKAPQDADHFVADGRLSRYADLSPREAVKTFKLATVFCLLAGLNALNDGYGFALPGERLKPHEQWHELTLNR